MSRWLKIVAVLGLIDAVYLTYSHYADSSVLCVAGNTCDQVLNSQYAELFGLPTSLWGVFFYALVLILLWRNARLPLFLVTTIGFLLSLYFVYLQFFEIEAICTYCLLSAAFVTILFIGSIHKLTHTKPQANI